MGAQDEEWRIESMSASVKSHAGILPVRYIGSTVPFANAFELSTHFMKHGHKFGATSEEEYERMADEFMAKPLDADLYECTAPHGRNDRIRLEGATRYFGVAYRINTIATFHPRGAHAIASKGGPLGFVLFKCAEVRN